MPPTSLQTSTDYYPALLWLMNELNSARAAEVIAEFERRLGNLIPSEHRETNRSGSVKWEHYVRWSRQHLYKAGLMGSGGRGIWTITEAGRAWLHDHPDGVGKDLLALKATPQKETPRPRVSSFRWRGRVWPVDVEQLLTQAKDLLAQGPLPEATRFRDWAVYIDAQPVSVKWLFHLLTGADYNEFDSPTARRLLAKVGLVAEQIGATPSRRRRKSVAYDEDSKASHVILDQQINQIREYLRGRRDRPSDEVLCEWVHFCYTFQLFHEGAALFDLVNPAAVDPWPYERAKRVAKVCHIRANMA